MKTLDTMSSTARCMLYTLVTKEAAWQGTIAQGKLQYDWNYNHGSTVQCYM